MARAIIIVLDGAGIGELPDAADYGDAGSHTLGHIYAEQNPRIPTLLKMGLGNIKNSMMPPEAEPTACFGKCAELFPGKDTTGGHWEIAGLILDKPLRTYPNGFPESIITAIEEMSGRKVIGNIVASGTEIINNLGDEHMESGALIVYTSADSVLQIAAHEKIVPVEELYEICADTRRIMSGEHAVGRIIARPFLSSDNKGYYRTDNRRDFSIEPPSQTILDAISKSGQVVAGIGKINDIFTGRGITRHEPAHGNDEITSVIKGLMAESFDGLIFANLVDFDMLYGHRNDAAGYAAALERFDAELPGILSLMRDSDLIIITADHGCDPTTPSTDHSREYVPVLAYTKALKRGLDIGVRSSFADIGATVCEHLSVVWTVGNSFLGIVKRGEKHDG
ncbi:MAG: phosphopentomutase [Christensenellales bacterium]